MLWSARRTEKKRRSTSNETIQFLFLLLRRRVFGTIVRRVINRGTRRGFLPLSSSFFESAALSNGTATTTGVTARSREARDVHLAWSRWTDRRDDGYSNHDMHCRDRATPCYDPHTCTRDHSGYTTIISTHMHARLTARKHACMHNTTRVPRVARCDWSAESGTAYSQFDRLTLSHYARSDSSLPYTFSHLTFKPLRTSCLPSRYILAYLPTQMIFLMLSKDVACRHQLLSFLALIPL